LVIGSQGDGVAVHPGQFPGLGRFHGPYTPKNKDHHDGADDGGNEPMFGVFAQNFEHIRFLSGGLWLFEQLPGFLGLGALGILLDKFLQGHHIIGLLIGLLVGVSLTQEGRGGQNAVGVLLVPFY
jgi:hypothetical protein